MTPSMCRTNYPLMPAGTIQYGVAVIWVRFIQKQYTRMFGWLFGVLMLCSVSSPVESQQVSPSAEGDSSWRDVPGRGCMNSSMFNYDSNATIASDNCVEYAFGCTNNTAVNYNPSAPSRLPPTAPRAGTQSV